MHCMAEITSKKGVAFGKPVIKGTPVRVEDVLGLLSEGLSTKEVCEEYSLTEEQVREALRYARDEMSGQHFLSV